MKTAVAKALLVMVLGASLLFLHCDTKNVGTEPPTPSGSVPDTPTNPNPADDATDVSINPTLSWDGGDPDVGDVVKYDVFLGPSSGSLVKVSSAQSTTSFSAGPLEYDTEYNWYILATDQDDHTASNLAWSFTTEPESGLQEGVFAALVVGRQVMNTGGPPMYYDQIVARFDTGYAPCTPVEPLQADSVKCNDYLLAWQTGLNNYLYMDPLFQPFIETSEQYNFHVYGNAEVPDLNDTISFPACAPYVTNITSDDTLLFTGFDVSWADYCSGNVRLLIMHGEDSTGIDLMTTNDGSYSFSENELSQLDYVAGEYILMLIVQNTELISATGYDSRSYIWSRSMNTTIFNIK